ncbi:MAG: cell division protein FtsA [Candidatus Magasanikbacteria bacterium RIFCSPHIGHO2_01_FULL_41_23]|uniref:Cell division protein FtsA n=1 Tax=Candidatus Magasanikbacteria bacterium RIFCSPLOWO2_01_FULL_40_15 TaxID=1798686 RepID=A0A1F6N276_9BACT|nr:MAG: cell division protein FtsA [Candidatus Magasanikbacteria bacterium RIFCSPHIGHO2_01_FULL_41_23]OGH67243.1 MAG: cell division protein FtsA [Candidatus Magasanikbacteria bacterium RIFCSPHIGHO2_02_FULL_41_35]OGH76646.1 MAG: cell division protein FtsA [Candidatus Magasanikbacteria bacterium RIFCSPHIGHO2_12_FULL_41_16]OGH77810.1 MAG: cell division protein FtsA [Candidatus Magasanikbacteria bacterium RIFCSPLOWO2_01_FULL_40_15]
MVRQKHRNEYITGLDIGSQNIRVAVGQISGTHANDREVQIIGAIEVPSEGVQKGVVTSIEEIVSSLANAIETAEKITGVPIEHVWVGLSGTHIICHDSKGVVAVARSDGEITEEDVARALEASKTVATPLNYEILHVLPRSFSVDGQTGIKDPIGMTGIRLEVDTKIIFGITAHVKNITKAIYRTGVDIDDFVLSVIAAGNVVLTGRQKELGSVVINIGSATTSLVVYEEGDIVHTAVLPVGSAHITNDLALGLKTSIDTAERVKVEYGQCVTQGLSKKDMVDLSTLGSNESETVSRYYISQIIEARVSEILQKVDNELTKVSRSGLLPAGAYFVGGGARLGGLIELAKEQLQLPASLGYPLTVQSITDKVQDPAFASVIGLVKWGSSFTNTPVQSGQNWRGMPAKMMQGMRSFLKNLLP